MAGDLKNLLLFLLYGIYSIYGPGHSFNFGSWGRHLFEVSAYSRLGAYEISTTLLQNNRVNKNKSQRCTKANFKHDIAVGTLRKIPAFS